MLLWRVRPSCAAHGMRLLCEQANLWNMDQKVRIQQASLWNMDQKVRIQGCPPAWMRANGTWTERSETMAAHFDCSFIRSMRE